MHSQRLFCNPILRWKCSPTLLSSLLHTAFTKMHAKMHPRQSPFIFMSCRGTCCNQEASADTFAQDYVGYASRLMNVYTASQCYVTITGIKYRLFQIKLTNDTDILLILVCACNFQVLLDIQFYQQDKCRFHKEMYMIIYLPGFYTVVN